MIKPEDLKAGALIEYRNGNKGRVVSDCAKEGFPVVTQRSNVYSMLFLHTLEGKVDGNRHPADCGYDITNLWKEPLPWESEEWWQERFGDKVVCIAKDETNFFTGYNELPDKNSDEYYEQPLSGEHFSQHLHHDQTPTELSKLVWDESLIWRPGHEPEEGQDD